MQEKAEKYTAFALYSELMKSRLFRFWWRHSGFVKKNKQLEIIISGFFSEMVRETLRSRGADIMKNIVQNNPLMDRLSGDKK